MDLGTSGSDLATRVAESRVSVLVLDLPAQEAAAVAAQLIAGTPRLRVLAVSVLDRVDDVAALAEAGLHGLLHAEDTFEDLLRSIEAVQQGDAVCSPRISRTLLRHLLLRSPSASPEGIADKLSLRERQVARLLQQGLSNKEIGDRLRIGPGTVKNHVHRILAKLSIHHRWEVAQPTGSEIPQAPRGQ